MKKIAPALLILCVFLLMLFGSCSFSMYKQELSMFRYPFEEYFRYTLTSADRSEGRRDVLFVPDAGADENVLLLIYSPDSYTSNTYDNFRLEYWNGAQFKEVTGVGYASRWTFSLGSSGQYVFVYYNDVIPAYEIAVLELVDQGPAIEAVPLNIPYQIDGVDFPAVPGNPPPENFHYSGGRLYFTLTDGGVIYEVSYSVDSTGISDPQETYGAFVSAQDISTDYFDPLIQGITFWTYPFVQIEEYRHDPAAGVTLFLMSRRNNLTEEDYRFTITYDGTSTSGEQVPDTFSRGRFTSTGYAVGEFLNSEPDRGEEVIRVLDSSFNERGSLEFYADELDFYTDILIGGESYLLFVRDIGDIHNNDEEINFFFYKLPFSYVLENG